MEVLNLLLLSLISTVTGYLCPPGWLSWKDNCYLISKGGGVYPTKSWDQAYSICKQMQADLLSIESPEEFDWMSLRLNEITADAYSSQKWWVGLTDRERANDWAWNSTGQLMEGANEIQWVTGHPKDHDEKDCLHKVCNRCALISTLLDFVPTVRRESSVQGLLEQGCRVRNPYICKRTNITELRSKCDYADGWHEVGEACWKLFSDRKMSWSEARDYCQIPENGRLATIHSAEEQKALLTASSSEFGKFWIGLQVNKTGSRVEGLWVDGSSLGHHVQPTFWAVTQPDFTSVSRGCVYMDNSLSTEEGWHLDGCYEDRSYICQKPQGVCPPNWATVSGRCYEVNIQNKRSWAGAKEYCAAQNTSLMIVDSDIEQRFLKFSRFIYKIGVDALWLGFQEVIGSYLWISGDRVNMSDLVVPNDINAGNDLCGVLYTDGDSRMSVTDNCAEKYPFICEAAAKDTVIRYQHPPVTAFCEDRYYQYRGQCYKMISDDKNWNDARDACKAIGATLVSISNGQEQAFINSRTSQKYWIGLSAYGKNPNWRWLDANAPRSFRNFIVGFTGRLRQAANCVVMLGRTGRHKGQWSPDDCDKEQPYICEKAGTAVKVTPTPPPVWNPDCGKGWHTPDDFGPSTSQQNFCYQVNKENKVWVEAQDDCIAKGGQLASISSPYEQSVLKGFIPHSLAGFSAWIGGSDKSTYSAWRWVDGAPFSYMNWDGIQAKSRLIRCIAMKLESKAWVSMSCDRKQAYICKKPMMNQVTPPTTTEPIITIPRGKVKACADTYKLVGSNCYKFYKKSTTQRAATSTCKRDGATLASVHSELENINEMRVVYKGQTGVSRWWIGLEDGDRDGLFTWQDGGAVDFVDWGQHQPTQIHGDKKCVMMTQKNGKWVVAECSELAAGFICKSNPTVKDAPSSNKNMKFLCPSLATHMTDTTCYLRAFSTFNWQTANDSCQLNNMQLGWFDSPEEAAYVMDLYSKTGIAEVWLSYNNKKGTYLSHGQIVKTGQYLPPWNKRHTGNELDSYVYMKTRSGELYDESDYFKRRAYICKSYRLDHNAVPKTKETTCPDKWYSLDGLCYMAFQSYRRPEKKSWYEAREHCQALGGDLASIHAQYINDTILKGIFRNKLGQVQKSEYWIGLNKLDRSTGHRWSDGSNVDMTAWEPGEPNDLRLSEACVVANIDAPWRSSISMTWNDKYCITVHDYVCQIPAGTTSATLMPTTTRSTPSMIPGVRGKCDPGWLQYKTNCYKFKQDYVSWHEAKADCEKEHSHLVVIHTKEENTFITSQVTKSSGHYAIGLTQFGGRKWSWIDGSPLQVDMWAENEPSGSGGAEKCGQIYYDGGFWNDYNCGLQNRGHICQKPVNGFTLAPTTTTKPGVGNCQSGFKQFGQRCYAVLGTDTPRNWTQAQSKCREFGPYYDLTSVHGRHEQAFMSVLAHKINNAIWIGLTDLSHSRKFIWSNNDMVGVTHWASGEPKYSSKERCVYLLPDVGSNLGEWKTSDCDEELHYLCSGPLDRRILTPPTTTPSILCRRGYEEFDGQCYKVYTSPLNFDDAANNCDRYGSGYLVSINSAGEQAFVEVLLAKNLGKPAPEDVWIGMRREEYQVNELIVGQYEWQDYYLVKYSRWSPGQPRHIDKVPNCVSMNTASGRWMSVNCHPLVTKPYVCKISTVPPPTRSPNRYVCDIPGAHVYRDMCYKFYTPRYGKSWHRSSSDCLMEGMELASIHNGDIQDFFTYMIKFSENPKHMWIGLVKSKSGGFVWADKSEFEYEQWGPGEPAARLMNQVDICGFMKYDGSSIHYGANWTLDRCYASKGWICQRPAVPLTVPTTLSTTTVSTTTVKEFCDGDSNWKYYHGYCYYIGDERISWHESNDKCRAMSSQLVSLHGKEEMDFLLSKVSHYMKSYIAAIGLTKLGLSNWGWTDKSLVDYINWAPNEPNNKDKSERCSFMFTHTLSGVYEKTRWNDEHCSALGGYFCKRPEIPLPITLSPAIMSFRPGNCPADWVEFGGMCYALFTDKPLNWTDARDVCRTKGLNGDLVAIHNAKEQAFLTSQLWEMDANIWIGLSDRFWNGHFWWSNSDPVQYTNWMNNEPNLRQTLNCVEMTLHNWYPGKWRDEDCSVEQSYMCIIDKDVSIVNPVTLPPAQECSLGYVYYNSACYRLYTEKVSWDTAGDVCTKNGGALVSITSPYEQAFVESLLVYQNEPVWTGMVELEMPEDNNGTSDQFYWDDGWPVTYTLWDDGRPIPSKGSKIKCVTINPLTGKWNDTLCYFSHAFVCKQTQVLPPIKPDAIYTCNDEEINFEDKCFLFPDNDKKSWSDAHLSCMQMGMELASFHSSIENKVVMDILYESKTAQNIWVGLVRNIKGGFYWLDQTPADYTYWSRNQPDDKNDNEACVEMVWNDNGRWNDVNCNNKLNYLCERPAAAVLVSSTTTQTTPSTPKPMTTQTTPSTPKPTTTQTTTSTPKPTTTQMTPTPKPLTTQTTLSTPKPMTQPTLSTPNPKSNPILKSTTLPTTPLARRPGQTVTPAGLRHTAAPEKKSNGPVIAGVVIGILLMTVLGILIGYFVYRRSKKSNRSLESWSGASFRPDDTDDGGGTLRFTNELYDKDSAEGDNSGNMVLQAPTVTAS